MSLLSLSIVIPTYNGRQLLERCLRSVDAHAPPGTQIIVVDDASMDNTVSWLKAHYPKVELVRFQENQGFCRAINAGIQRARGDVVELLNNDTEVYAGWAEACLKHFDDPGVGSVAPLVTSLSAPDVVDSFGQEYHVCGWAFDRAHGRTLPIQPLVVQEVFGASGSCGFYRRQALLEVGGLWSIYGFYFEDTDLAFRLRWAGYKSICEPASRVAHLGSATTEDQLNARKVWLLSRNEEIVFWANLPKRDLLLGLIPHLGFLAVRAGRKLWNGQLRIFLSGKLDAVRQFSNIRLRRRQNRCLAQEGAGPVSLILSRHPRILLHGIKWLRRRAV
jgi:GT2 family glycosyltransferase